VIVQVAAFRPEKAHHHAIEALAIMHRTTSLKPFLLFVGGGDENSERDLRTLARNSSVERYVVFCGQHADVRSFYWMADLFTLSSISETFSIAALEAMSTGLPGVLTNVGGAAEMIVEGRNGYLVPPHRPDLLAEAWKRALSGGLSWSAGRIREYVVASFALDSCVKSYEDVLLS
jgi:glycosyltransferase involved in cell wall biosynthesis